MGCCKDEEERLGPAEIGEVLPPCLPVYPIRYHARTHIYTPEIGSGVGFFPVEGVGGGCVEDGI